MKKIRILLLMVLLSMALAVSASAGCTVSGTSSAGSLEVGDRFLVTFSFSGSDKIGASEATISYDPAVLGCSSGSGSSVSVQTDGTGKTSWTVTVLFTAKAAGDTSVQLTSSNIRDEQGNLLGTPANVSVGASVAGGAAPSQSEPSASTPSQTTPSETTPSQTTPSETIPSQTTPSAAVETPVEKSNNCNLTALEVPEGCTLSPAFRSGVTSYTCTVPYEVTSFSLEPTKADSKAAVSFFGQIALAVGENTRGVRVTAEDGTVKTYTVVITRLEQEAEEEEQPEETPVTVTVGGRSLTLDAAITLPIPEGYTATQITCLEQETQAAALGELQLVQLTGEEGPGLYLLQEDDSFLAYRSLTSDGETYTVLPFAGQVPEDYRDGVLQLDGAAFTAKKAERLGSSDAYVITAVDQATGQQGLYLYNQAQGSVIPLAGEYLEPLKAEPEQEEDSDSAQLLVTQPQKKTAPPVVLIGILILAAAVVVAAVAGIVSRKRAAARGRRYSRHGSQSTRRSSPSQDWRASQMEEFSDDDLDSFTVYSVKSMAEALSSAPAPESEPAGSGKKGRLEPVDLSRVQTIHAPEE